MTADEYARDANENHFDAHWWFTYNNQQRLGVYADNHANERRSEYLLKYEAALADDGITVTFRGSYPPPGQEQAGYTIAWLLTGKGRRSARQVCLAAQAIHCRVWNAMWAGQPRTVYDHLLADESL